MSHSDVPNHQKTGSWPSVVPIAAPRRTPASFRLTIPQFKEPDFAFGLTDKKWYDAIDAQPPVLSSTAASLSAKTSPAPAPASVDGAGGGPSVVKTETPNSQVSVGDKRAPSHSAPSIVTSAVRPPPPKRRPFDLKATEAERKRRKYILKNFTPAEYHNNICKYCKVNEGCNRFAIDHWGDDGEA